MNHEHERPLRIALVLEPIEREIRNDLGHVAGRRMPAFGGNEIGPVVLALAGQDIPIIEAGRVAYQVPFADHRRLITGRAQQLRKRHLAAVEFAVRIVVEAVLVAVLARQDAGPARPTKRIGNVTPIESHSVGRDPIDIRRVVQFRFVRANRLVSMIIAHDEQNVRPFRRNRSNRIPP